MKFFKLLKYEFLENIVSIALINILLLGLFYIMTIYLNGDIDDLSWIFGFVFALTPITIFFLFIFLLNIIIKTLYARLFNQEGYLTFSLPVSIDAILVSKILISMLWVSISAFVFCLWFVVGIIDNKFNVIYNFFHIIIENYNLLDIVKFIMLGLCIISKPIVLVLLVLSILHIGKITRFKQIIGIVLFFVIWLAENFVSICLFMLINNIFPFDASYSPLSPISHMQGDNIALFITLHFIISILPTFVYYYLSRYLIKNKLEI